MKFDNCLGEVVVHLAEEVRTKTIQAYSEERTSVYDTEQCFDASSVHGHDE